MSYNNHVITISTCTITKSGGHDVESWSTPVSVRAEVTQVDGSRYVKDDEQIDSAVYKIKLYDNSYGNNVKITYNGLTLYPVKPVTVNKGKGSLVNEVIIIAAVKK